jgi:hypothetical protein
VVFRNKFIFYGEELLAPTLKPHLEDHPFLAVRDCLFNIFAATLQNWRASPPSANLRTRHAVVTRDPRNMEKVRQSDKKLDNYLVDQEIPWNREKV